MKGLVRQVKNSAEVKEEKKKAGKVVPDDPSELELSLVSALNVNKEETKWKQSDSFAPSNTSNCARFHFYRFTGYEQDSVYSAQTLRIFDLGNRVEDAVGEMFKGLGVLLDEQVEINLYDPPIHGYIDFIIDWDGPKVVECKSINENGFVYRKAMRKPTDSHYAQIQWYMKAMDHEEGFVFYYAKNTSEILPLLVKRNDKWLEKTSQKYGIIHKAFMDGTKPERPYKVDSPTCAKCDARRYCWEVDTEVGVKIK